jgi:glycosyltransferase involved in cell wall biosynthesis
VKAPWLSIILPFFNAQATLPAAMGSVLKCRNADFEVVVIDDGSQDGSGGMADMFADRDSRIRVIHTEHQGLIQALNTGIDAAWGTCILRMDADDISHPGRVQFYQEYINSHPEVEVVGSLIRYFPRLGLKDGLIAYEQWVNSLLTHDEMVRDLFVECPIPHPTLAYRKADAVDAGGYCDNGMPEDYDLILRLWERGRRLGKVPRQLLFWRDRPDRLSRTDPRYGIDRFMTLKVSVLKRTLLKHRDAVVSAAGPVGKAFARELSAQGIRITAFLEVDPDKIGNTVYGIPVWSVERARDIGDALILHAVGQKGGRDQGRQLYLSRGLREGDNFICVS